MESFDVILDENQLEDACEHLADYLEAYWKATHPPSSSLPNPLLSRTLATSTLPRSPTLASHSQALTNEHKVQHNTIETLQTPLDVIKRRNRARLDFTFKSLKKGLHWE